MHPVFQTPVELHAVRLVIVSRSYIHRSYGFHHSFPLLYTHPAPVQSPIGHPLGMTAKRKSSAIADAALSESFDSDGTTSTVGSIFPRRSMRARKSYSETHVQGARAKPVDPPTADDVKCEISAELGLETNASAGVNDAIRDLAKMERRLRRATKRQKLKIEESVVIREKEGLEDDNIGVDANPTLRGPRPKRAENKGYVDALPTPERDAGPDGEISAERKARKVADEEYEPDAEAAEMVERGAARAPAVNSDFLPLPWKGRLGYACLNTYLRYAKPPVFSSRTCRMASIIDHRYPLMDPSQPEHATKNRPDKTKTPDVARGQRFVQELGLANARDIVKMLRWNDKYGIKFMRLSSEMFPFASHEEHGYKLAPFASEVLSEAGKVAAELGHRLTMHPGQFTQLGSPRPEVVRAAVRDLEFHDELLTLLKLPPQQDRDAVLIMHMGGILGDKAATLDRFRENYTNLLSPSIKRRVVLENDDMGWSVHDLLPICEEMNIPLVLDWHHNNIVFDPAHIREGTFDISQPEISERISATWRKKGITQKMHYSESCPGAVTPRDRRKHRPRVATLPPCPVDMDLMIEAKDKEQAVFELMKTFRLPGADKLHDIVPHEREDQDRPVVKKKKAKKRGKKKDEDDDEIMPEDEYDILDPGLQVPEEQFAMGGPQNRVYWPPGMEDWLRPKKREVKSKGVKVELETQEGEEDETVGTA